MASAGVFVECMEVLCKIPTLTYHPDGTKHTATQQERGIEHRAENAGTSPESLTH